MKRNLISILVLTLIFLSSCSKKEEVKLDSEKAKTSYALGLNLAKNMKASGDDLDQKAFCQAILDYFDGKPQIDEKDIEAIIKKYQDTRMKDAQAKQTAAATANLKEGEEFLKANASKEGVVTTASGLQYIVLTEGKGAQPKATDKVKVHYEGKLINGTVFDSSYKRNKPTEFFLNRVIKGWTEGVALMKTGSKYRFFIPAALAYGPRGAGSVIGPNSTLVFEIELLEIVK